MEEVKELLVMVIAQTKAMEKDFSLISDYIDGKIDAYNLILDYVNNRLEQ